MMSNASSNRNSWDAAVEWISNHGGFVNPLLCYDASHRQVYVKEETTGVTQSCDVAEREAKCSINEGDLLLRIPDACLLSLHTIEATTFGRSLFAVIHSMFPKHDMDSTSQPSSAKRARVDTKLDGTESQLYNDEQDVIMALFLAYLVENKDREPTIESCKGDTSQPWLFYRPYLDTLPINTSNLSSGVSTNEYLNLLPRQWPLEIIDHRLKGTSLYQRVLDEKKGLVDEYDKIKSAWQSNNHSELFPSLKSYDMMMAAVSSRGFSGLGYEEVDVMIPLLDLLNHARGGGDENAKMIENVESSAKSDVRYKRYENSDSGSTISPLDHSNLASTDFAGCTLKRKENTVSKGTENYGGVKVMAAGNLQPGMKLLMTYGAKSNISLLGRYGFCIQNNFEPDGSCNDIVEIQLLPEKKPVRLQMGPKSYSYLPFVEALSLFYNSDSKENHTSGTEECDLEARSIDWEGFDLDDNVDAFLDACDNESYDEDEDEAFSCYNTAIEDSTLGEHPADEKRIKSDVCALNLLIRALSDAKSQRSTNTHASTDEKMHSIQEKYCLILAESEIHTISFFLAVSRTLKQQLGALCEESFMSTQDANCVPKNEGATSSFDDKKAQQKHIDDVVDAFIAIRASAWSKK